MCAALGAIQLAILINTIAYLKLRAIVFAQVLANALAGFNMVGKRSNCRHHHCRGDEPA